MGGVHVRYEVDGVVVPRPVAGHVALDLVNTYAGWGSTAGREYLVDYDALVVWAGEAGLVSSSEVPGLRQRAREDGRAARRTLERAVALRSALHEVVSDPDHTGGMEVVGAAAARAAGRARIDGGPRPRWVAADGLDRPLDAAALAAADLVTRTDLGDVHSCPGDGCGWMFLDPRGRRRWCRMEWCGNRSKVRAHAERVRRAPVGDRTAVRTQ